MDFLSQAGVTIDIPKAEIILKLQCLLPIVLLILRSLFVVDGS